MLENEIPRIIPIWKPVGESTHRIAKSVSEVYNILSSHTGTLDPMAEGVIVVLIDETRLRKYEYAKWKKTYEFDIVLGLKSDSLDGLGIVEIVENKQTFNFKKLEKVLDSMQGAYTQKIPNYSAIKVKGKELHWWARNNRLSEIEIPTRSGEIDDLKLMEITQTRFGEIALQTIKDIRLVDGDLRQDLAIACWKNIENKYGGEKTTKFKLRVQMSKGLYVRQLTQDILGMIGLIGITLNIKRTQNGKYAQNNCYTLSQIIPITRPHK